MSIKLIFLLLLFVMINTTLHAGTFNFDSDQPGTIPKSFTTALTGKGVPGTWVILKDLTAPGKPNVLAQTSMDSTNYRFPVCIYDGLTAVDVDISVRFKPIKGRVTRPPA